MPCILFFKFEARLAKSIFSEKMLAISHGYLIFRGFMIMPNLDSLQLSLDRYRAKESSLSELLQQCRHHEPLLDRLPPAFAQVWHALLDRLESSALFDEESCSFSRHELLDHLAQWIAKARLRGA